MAAGTTIGVGHRQPGNYPLHFPPNTPGAYSQADTAGGPPPQATVRPNPQALALEHPRGLGQTRGGATTTPGTTAQLVLTRDMAHSGASASSTTYAHPQPMAASPLSAASHAYASQSYVCDSWARSPAQVGLGPQGSHALCSLTSLASHQWLCSVMQGTQPTNESNYQQGDEQAPPQQTPPPQWTEADEQHHQEMETAARRHPFSLITSGAPLPARHHGSSS